METQSTELLSNEQLEQQATDLRNNGQVEAAVAVYRQLLSRFEIAGNMQRAAGMQHMIGVTFKVGNYTEPSLAALADARQRYQDVRDLVGVGRVLRDEGITYQYAKNFVKAKPLLEQSIATLEAEGSLDELGISEVKLGYWYQETGDLKAAGEWMQRGLETLLQTDQWFYTSTAYFHMAGLAHMTGAQDEALNILANSEQLITEHNARQGQKRRLAQINMLRAEALAAQGKQEASNIARAKSEAYLAELDEASAEYLRSKDHA